MIDYTTVEEIEIECSTLCNAKCPLCYRNYKSFQTSSYNKPFIREINDVIQQLDQFSNLRYVMLVGSMSEPTLYPNFLQLVAYLKKRNIQLEICTNGSTHDDAFWHALALLLDNNDKIYFTICGSNQEIHAMYRCNTDLNKILHNAYIVRQILPIDYAQCIRFNYNTANLDSKQFKDLIQVFSHIYMTETFYPKDISNYAIPFDIDKFKPNSIKLPLYDKLKSFVEHNVSSRKQTYECICINRHRYQIDVFGNIYPCYLFLEHLNGIKWNQNLNELKYVNYDCCKFCEKIAKLFSKKHNLDYII